MKLDVDAISAIRHALGNRLRVGTGLTAIRPRGCWASSVVNNGKWRLQSFWWPQVARVETERFATRSDAIQAEYAAIRTERPKYNLDTHMRSLGKVPYEVRPAQRWLLPFVASDQGSAA